MARLPTVGGDSGNWGTVLNEYLGTAHNADGTLKLDVQTIDDLKAIDVATLTDKQQALVAGYSAPGDGGGGQLYYDAAAVDADNGGTIIAPSAGAGRWKRIYSGALNVRWFGAKGDGTTDDTAALQAAFNMRGAIRLPAGQYVISTAINATNNWSAQMTVFGDGWTETGLGSVIYAQTGGVAIDLTGSQFVSIRDLSIVSQGRSNPSTVGILFARATSPASEYSQFNTLQNVYIDIASDMTAYGGRGTVGVYNRAAEINSYTNVYIKADTPVYFGTSNPWSVSSPYQTINDAIVSTSVLTISGASTLTAKGSTCYSIYILNAYSVDIIGAYLSGGNGAGMAAVYAAGAKRLFLTAHIENASRIIFLAACSNVSIDVTVPDSMTYSPVYLGDEFTWIMSLDIKITYGAGGISASPYVVEGLQTSSISKVSIDIDGDLGTVPATNVWNVQGLFRKVASGTLNKGGYQNLRLTGTPVVETWLKYDQQAAASVASGSLFVDSADGKLKFKDAGDVVRDLY